MMKPLLLVSAIALAAPALAQSTTTGTNTQTNTSTTGTASGPNDDVGAVGGNTVNSQNPTHTPFDADDDDDDSAADHSAMGHSTTGTAAGTTAGSIGTSGTVSGTGATQGTMTTSGTGTTGMTGQTSAWSNSPAMSGRTMANWDFSGDWGEIGSSDWGVGTGTSMAGTTTPGTVSGQSSGYTGVGGPIDVASQWSAISSTGGDLTPLEFGLWLLEQNGKDVDRQVEATRRSRASNLPAIQVLNVTAGALAQADANGDWRVSQSELQAFAGM